MTPRQTDAELIASVRERLAEWQKHGPGGSLERNIVLLCDRLEAALAALRFYSLHEHWMALTEGADSPAVVWIARTHLDKTADGWSTAEEALGGKP